MSWIRLVFLTQRKPVRRFKPVYISLPLRLEAGREGQSEAVLDAGPSHPSAAGVCMEAKEAWHLQYSLKWEDYLPAIYNARHSDA